MNLFPQTFPQYQNSLNNYLDSEFFGMETRSRTASSSSFSSIGSQDYQTQYNTQNNLNDLNFLLSFLTQTQPVTIPCSPNQQFTQLRPSPQLQIPKPIRCKASSSVNQNSNKSHLFLEASLNIVSSLLLKKETNQNFISRNTNLQNDLRMMKNTYDDSNNQHSNLITETINSKDTIAKSPQSLLSSGVSFQNSLDSFSGNSQSPLLGCMNLHSNGSSFQTQIPYQPNIIFDMDMTVEETQLRRDHRRQKILKYLEKKETRRWNVLRYEVRKKIAKTRQRVKGRFVKEDKTEA